MLFTLYKVFTSFLPKRGGKPANKMVISLSANLRWRVIYHRYIYGSSADENARYLFVSKRFVSNIRALRERTRDVLSTMRRRGLRVLSVSMSNSSLCDWFQLVSRQFVGALIWRDRFYSLFILQDTYMEFLYTDSDNTSIRNMLLTKPELYIDEYVDWFGQITGGFISLTTMCGTIIRLGFTHKKANASLTDRLYFCDEKN